MLRRICVSPSSQMSSRISSVSSSTGFPHHQHLSLLSNTVLMISSRRGMANSSSHPSSSASRSEQRQDDAVEEEEASTEDVIGASFGMQVRPSWSFSHQDLVAAAASHSTATPTAEPASPSAAVPTSELPEIRKTTEIVPDDGIDETCCITGDGEGKERRLRQEQQAHNNALADEIKRGVLPTTTPQEDFILEFQRYHYKNNSQVGAYIGATPESEERRQRPGGGSNLALRQRREIERVPPWQPPFEAMETSFRRLPKDIRLPNERTLRYSYPMHTELPIEWKDADCADFNMMDIESDAAPIKYGILKPRNFDPNKEHPVLVWLSDHRGEQVDFEDSCHHLFERGPHYERWYENGWVIVSPVIAVKNAQIHAQEGVVARFCDWLCDNYKVENGKVHLGGKGLGGYAALRSVLEMKKLAVSCTAILGRMGGPYRPLDRPQEKAHNIQGTHVLMYVPGDMRKTDYVYKFKGFCDLAKVRPPVRAVHFADVRDHQVYYAVNPAEFWNYLDWFRRNCLHQPAPMNQP